MQSEKPQERDACSVCHGSKGGVPGNENIIEGVTMCDYCHAEHMDRIEAARAALTLDSTLPDLVATLPIKQWFNDGNMDFISWGGFQIRLDAERNHFDILELLTPADWGENDFVVQIGMVPLHKLFVDPAALLRDLKLTPDACTALSDAWDSHVCWFMDGKPNPTLGEALLRAPGLLFRLATEYAHYHGVGNDGEGKCFPGREYGIETWDDNGPGEARLREAVRQYLARLGVFLGLPEPPGTPLTLPDAVLETLLSCPGKDGQIEGVHYTWRSDLGQWEIWTNDNTCDEVVLAATERQAALEILKLMDASNKGR